MQVFDDSLVELAGKSRSAGASFPVTTTSMIDISQDVG